MRLLVIRLSAMGDVVLTLPVLRGLLNKYPDVRITLVTRRQFGPFFSNIDRLEIIHPDFRKRHDGLKGIFLLFSELRNKNDYDIVIDLHRVLRTNFLRFLFRLTGNKCFTINKERYLKQFHLQYHGEPKLKHVIDRYMQVFEKAGFVFRPMKPPVFCPSETNIAELEQYLTLNNLHDKNLIGIAPFARHKLKVLPNDKLQEVIIKISAMPDTEIILFGGGSDEIKKLKNLSVRHSKCHIVNISLEQELVLIKRLKLMITMDSGNMHIAALTGIPVISIWGATHPGMGFGAWKQPAENTIQIPVSELECRPCTVFGKGTCSRGDFACMQRIKTSTIIDRVIKIIG